MMSYELEMTQKVYDNNSGEFIEVTESVVPGNVLLNTRGSGQEYFGATHLDLPVDAMRKLAKAINLVCDSVDNKDA